MSAKKAIITENRFLNSVNIGLILKAQREHLNLSQKTIADRLGFRNYNYISMVERGDTTLSLPKIINFIRAYELPAQFGLVVLKGLYPDFYEIMFDLNDAIAARSMKDVDAEIQAAIAQLMKDFGVKPKDSMTSEKVFAIPQKATS